MKTIYFYIVLFLNLHLICLQAQHSLYVKAKNGTQNEYSINEIRKLEFNEGNMTVSKTDGSSAMYALIDIGYLSFTDYNPGIFNLPGQELNAANIFPNPVEDQLTIIWPSALTGINTIYLEIIDIMGSIILTECIDNISGTDRHSICVTRLPKGIYLFRISDGRTIQVMKFYKK